MTTCISIILVSAGKFMAAMAAEGLINEESISTQELDRVYGPLRQQVVDSCQRQEMLMARIQVSLGLKNTYNPLTWHVLSF